MAAAKKKQRPVWVSVAKWLAIGVAAREVYLALGPSRQKRRDIFNLAQHQAKQSGKRLIVVGSPDTGIVNRFVGRDYDCGDLCLDLVGCMSCDNYAQGRLEDVLPQLESNSAVVYVSMTLEYVQDLDKVLAELERVSGGDLYVVTVPPWTLTAFLYPGARRQFLQAPPDDAQFQWRPHYWSPKQSAQRTYVLGPNA
jgi:hypothetical protein